MKTTMTTDAVLNVDDLSAESALLRPYDLTSLHTRLEGAIRRRQIATALLAGAAALAAAGGIAHLASRDWTPAPPPPPVIEEPLLAAVAPIINVEIKAPAKCSDAPVIVVAPSAQAAAPTTTTTTTTITSSEVVRVEGDDSERIVVEGSRLRSQLRIFDEGERALVGGDPERALARVHHLREKYPNGPLDIDAAILGVRALRALDRLDEARDALTAVEKHPLAAEKSAVLAELRALLTQAEPERPSRVLKSWPRGVHGKLIEPTEELVEALAAREGEGDAERQPTRVIEPVAPTPEVPQ